VTLLIDNKPINKLANQGNKTTFSVEKITKILTFLSY